MRVSARASVATLHPVRLAVRIQAVPQMVVTARMTEPCRILDRAATFGATEEAMRWRLLNISLLTKMPA